MWSRTDSRFLERILEIWLYLQDESIGNWMLTRVVDGQEKPEFVFDSAMRIKPNGRVKVRNYQKRINATAKEYANTVSFVTSLPRSRRRHLPTPLQRFVVPVFCGVDHFYLTFSSSNKTSHHLGLYVRNNNHIHLPIYMAFK